ncbi:MAG: hypothetical protein ISS71_02445 [Phycisphaerae bacterium]|nr:hypothetical protein [Phycisphaerae bacterium]
MKQITVFLVFFLVFPLHAVTTSDIEEIRLRTENNRSELQTADHTLIEEFWETSLNTMLLSETAQDIVDIRRRLEEQMGDEPLSFYTSAYILAAKRNLQTSLENVARIEDAQKQQLVKQNLMVLTAQLKNPSLADTALPLLNDKNPVVRYWAVKAVTNSGVIQLLSSEITADEKIEEKILNALKQRLEFEQQVEIQTMIINFAVAMDHPTAREILLTIADQCIDAYKNWSFEHGGMDAELLIAMGNIAMMAPDAEVKRTFARKFAELYSLVFQCYMSGQDVLSDAQIEQLINVILEVDKAVLGKMLSVPQTGVFRAIQRKVGLDREYETIFGDRLRSGDLGTLYKFDYGKDASGKPITEPPAIGEPPASLKRSEE